jgi:hypothetical protein
MFDQMKQFYADSLASIRATAEKEGDRLADELEAQKASKLARLKARLEKRKLGHAGDIDSEDVLDVIKKEMDSLYNKIGDSMNDASISDDLVRSLDRQKANVLDRLNDRLLQETKEKGGDLSLDRACKMCNDEYVSFYEGMLQSIKSSSDREANRLAQDLEAQRQAKIARLSERLAERRQRDGEMTIDELNSLSREELDTIVSIENEAVEKTQSIREKMLMMIKSEHETEAARLDEELRYKRDKQKADAKARIDKKIAARAQELLESSAASDTPLEFAEAQALAEAEFKPFLDLETKKLNELYKGEISKDKMEIANAIKDVHEKELAKLQQLQATAEANQRKCFQDRLAQKKKLREMEASQQTPADVSDGIYIYCIQHRIKPLFCFIDLISMLQKNLLLALAWIVSLQMKRKYLKNP